MDKLLEFRNVSKRFGNTLAVDSISLAIQRGEFLSLLGPSGCGKTTLLRIAAGFEHPDAGQVTLDDADITKHPPERRPLNTIFQNYALFPHLSIRENLAFGLKASRQPAATIKPAVDKMLGLMRIEAQAEKKPSQLSGGEKQRVAIGRALINQPRVLLLDEPLAALDLKLRQQMLLELRRIQQEVGITFLYVTHDQSEALSLSHRIAVMKDGHVEQLGSPSEIYESPQTRFVASFIGDANVLDGVVIRCDSQTCRVSVAGLPELTGRCTTTLAPQSKVHVIIRPERLSLIPESVPGSVENQISVIIDECNFLGSHMRIRCQAAGHPLVLHASMNAHLSLPPSSQGAPVDLTWHASDTLVIPTEPRHA